jgi:hypothetical protein
MVKCHLCGRLRAIERACVCAAWVISLALGETHPEPQRFEPPPVAAAVAPSSARSTAGGPRWNAETGRYELAGHVSSTGRTGP